MGEVVVTGVGAISPLGVGASSLLARWLAGACAIEDGEAPCAEFDPGDFFTVKEARRADRFTQLALAASDEAIGQAGWRGGLPYEPRRIGCLIGTGIGGLLTLEDNHSRLARTGHKGVSPLAVPLMMGNAGTAAVSMRHGLCGPAFGVVSACAAGAHAIGTAMRTISAGDADAVVAGGAESALTPLARAAFGAMDATSRCGISRPFDARRDGFVMGEGAGVLVLEDAGKARARGARVLATLSGYGASSDAHHLTAPHASGKGAAVAIAAALSDAGLSARQVDCVNAHGTSTPLNDSSETQALKLALGERASQIPVSSLKGSTGHLLGAAGAVEAVAALLALRRREVAPTVGHEQAEPELDLDYVPGAARRLDVPDDQPGRTISNSVGFGGHNAVLVIEAFGAGAVA
ncbi:MAG TPA: beta-ketoacyl-ACP synthase II [Solirubrobacteraceae bacterium]|nr:beta-ketoacyl-ACP synthase II [Solirubrobacteraceae bacterium]